MIQIQYYRRSKPLEILTARPVPAEDAENWVREMNEAHPEFYYFITEN